MVAVEEAPRKVKTKNLDAPHNQKEKVKLKIKVEPMIQLQVSQVLAKKMVEKVKQKRNHRQ